MNFLGSYKWKYLWVGGLCAIPHIRRDELKATVEGVRRVQEQLYSLTNYWFMDLYIGLKWQLLPPSPNPSLAPRMDIDGALEANALDFMISDRVCLETCLS
jgi:hypothetical protein